MDKARIGHSVIVSVARVGHFVFGNIARVGHFVSRYLARLEPLLYRMNHIRNDRSGHYSFLVYSTTYNVISFRFTKEQWICSVQHNSSVTKANEYDQETTLITKKPV